nr:hypothetical protein [Tanacetum cinerariifolium]
MATTLDQQIALDEALVPSAQREMLHISPRIPGQSFAKLPFEEEILEFLRKKTSGSASSTTPIATPTPTTTVAAAPRLSSTAKGKQPVRATTPTKPTDVERTEAKQLKIVLKRSRHETHISQQRGSGIDEGTDNEDDDNNEEEQGLRIGEEERMKEEEDAEELYRIVNQYTNQQMPEAVREAMQTQTNQLQDSIQRENDDFLKTIDENMKKIIKEQVKSQVKAQVTRILPRIGEPVNAQLEAEVLTRSSHSSRTSYARSDKQQNLYKALVEAYDADKTILDTYGESTILKRRREDDDQEGPSAGSDRGSKRQREGGEHASASTPSEPATRKEPVQPTCQMEEPSHPVFEIGAEDQPMVQTSQHPEWFSQPSRPPSEYILPVMCLCFVEDST